MGARNGTAPDGAGAAGAATQSNGRDDPTTGWRLEIPCLSGEHLASYDPVARLVRCQCGLVTRDLYRKVIDDRDELRFLRDLLARIVATHDPRDRAARARAGRIEALYLAGVGGLEDAAEEVAA